MHDNQYEGCESRAREERVTLQFSLLVLVSSSCLSASSGILCVRECVFPTAVVGVSFIESIAFAGDCICLGSGSVSLVLCRLLCGGGQE